MPSRFSARSLGPPILLLTLVGVAFANALPAEFVFDSRPVIAEHPQLQAGSPWWELFRSTYWGPLSWAQLYRPFTMLTYWVERRVLGFDTPAPFAIVNIALHAGVTLLLWRLALEWTGRRFVAFAAAALFAVHPLATEVVPNLVGRADLLAALGTLGALWCWERIDRPRGWAWVLAACGCWVLGLLSKESAVAFPLIAGARDLWRVSGPGGVPLGWAERIRNIARARWWPYALLVVVTAAWWSVHRAVSSTAPPMLTSVVANPIIGTSTASWLMTVVLVWGLYLRVALVPIWLASDRAYADVMPVASPAEPAFIAACVAVALFIACFLASRRRFPGLVFGLAFAALAILPLSNLFITIGVAAADRLLYLPLAGLCVAAGAALDAAAAAARARWPGREAGLAAGVVLAVAVVLLGGRTWQRNAAWRTHEALLAQLLLDAPRNVTPHHDLALRAAREGRHDEAVHKIETVLAIIEPIPPDQVPDFYFNGARVHLAAGQAANARGDAVAAERYFERAAELARICIVVNTSPGAWTDYLPRLRAWNEAHGSPMALDEPLVRAYRVLGDALYGLRRWSESAEALGQAAARRPDHASLHAGLGRALANAGDLAAAEAALARAAELAPDDADTRRDLERVRAIAAERVGDTPPTPAP